ncbi:MAG: PilZ domain-containing protein [Myxococcota bacterium]
MTSNAALRALDPEHRTEPRDRSVHLVEYSPFPRRRLRETAGIGFTQDCSATGLGLDVAEPLRSGELLRVTLRDIDGGCRMEGLARVVWCRLGDVARYRVGLHLLRDAERRPLRRDAGAIRRSAHVRSADPDLLD